MSGEVYGPDGERLAPNPAPLSFKKGDRVAVATRAWAHATVEEVHSTLAMVRLDSGEYRSFLLGDLVKIPDPAPLSFSDVRSGDKITVEITVPIGGHYTITGEARRDGDHVLVGPILAMPGRMSATGWINSDDGNIARLIAHTPAAPSIPADWDLITAGDGRTYRRSIHDDDLWKCITEPDCATTPELLALGPVRRCVPVTVPEEGAPVVYAMPSRLDSRKVAIRDLAGTGATDVWPSDAKRYAAHLLAAALKAEAGR